MDPMSPPAMTDRDDPEGRAAGQVLVGLHGQHNPVRLADHLEHVHAGHVEQHVSPSAPAHARTTPTVIHVGVFLDQLASSLLIPKAPTPTSWLRHTHHRPAGYPRSDPKSRQPTGDDAIRAAPGTVTGVTR